MKIEKLSENRLDGAKPGDDIVVSKWIAIEGTSVLAKEREKELVTRYPQNLIDTAKAMDQYLSVEKEAAVAISIGVSAMQKVAEGGIFSALWELAEASGVGLEIQLRRIPIKQESVEICEFFDINPYGLLSRGSMLMAASDGNQLVSDLERAGIPAVVVGKATGSNDRVLINEDKKRFLERPKTDELYKVLD